MLEGSSITALLGPTNTGKTHRALERMLTHESGMIGLPLRLLAREVYDRLTTKVGEARVALVTGEEKRVPRRPDYWVCTVEAMPMDREVDFLAVDEIQLAAHDQRGHVFTERLLAARGRRETWFMGADTMRPLVRELVPTAVHPTCARLSTLGHTGPEKLARLLPRTAVVAFSMPQVYAIAERLRAQRGGAAVVLGALSPRARNAQVALFQAGEVDYLVATDAIGMGLNLDVTHVAFAALRKFDGRAERELDPAELSQIAGRAGRYLRDGTFGTVAPLRLPDTVAAAVEMHRFPAVRRLRWRNADLDFSSIDALLGSLKQRPRHASLMLEGEAEDAAALARLAQDPEIRARARGEEAVRLLWDVCRVPDFRKLLLESHVALLGEVFTMLSGPRGVLDRDWIAAHLVELDDVAGDIDTLIARMAAVRVWTYITHQTRWVEDATAWQERARDVEDRLSDALHERLVQRFVERGSGRRARSAPLPRPRPEHPRASQAGAGEANRSHPFAGLAALRDALAPPPPSSRDADDWIEPLLAAAHDRFVLDGGGRISFDDRFLGKLTRGPGLLVPEVKLAELDALGAGARSRILRRLVAFARDLVEALLAPLRAPALRALSAAGRGVIYQLEQGLGTALTDRAGAQIAELAAADRALLEAQGVRLGARVLYVPSLLRGSAAAQRLALASAYFDPRPLPPKPAAVSLALPRGADPRAYAAIGFPVFGTRAVRADVAERVCRALAEGASETAHFASWLGCPAREVPRITEALTTPSV
ncbi:ATP-dependent DNA helicase [Minicystis rosea]|nr:ATP-dependent DNA helicase [Minicystis rosea]